MSSHEYKKMMFSPDDFAHLKTPLKIILSATNKFDKKNIIGRGGIGDRYTGQISWSGELIDIRARRLNKDLQDREQKFWMEISMLSSLKHKNLVSLLGFCDENDEKIFIYKWGSLHYHLSDFMESKWVRRLEMRGSLTNYLSDSMQLTWVRRLEISVGVANALSYVHYDELRDFSVIHRNINSHTVLLNDDWEPKLSGFERSMKIKASERHHSFHTNRLEYVNGYGDPTYIETKSVNHKSDIYSFGVVLLELLCGRKSIIGNKDYNQLVPLAITLYREKKLINIIDRELLNQMDLHSFNMFADIAYECLDNERSRRPNIDDIVPRLEKALELQLKQQNYDNNSIVMFSHEYKDMMFSPDDFAHLKIPLEDIRSATNNFDEKNLIGRGGIGNHYTGQISWSGESIDIRARRLNKDLQDREQKFWMEISMLSSLKHKNLVSLVGFCDENDEKIFIYKSEVRGSLDYHLSDSMRLTWVRRLEISVGLANALSYIHYDEPRDFSVIHRLICSGTVLLNDDGEPKLSDFEGSMKIKASQRHQSFHTNKLRYVKGYGDPTYIETKSVNQKSDIYSFGIVLLELMCGRKLIIDNKDYNQLVLLAITLYREKKLINIIDRELLKQMDLHSFNMFADIAYECLDEGPSRLPNIDDIVPRLQKALELQLKSQNYDNNSIVEGTSSSSIQKKFQHLKIELQAIKSATNEFDHSHCIGKGGFGEVYKGELIHSKGQSVVALKRLNSRFGQGDIEFWKEIIMLSSYRHNNIVSLLGFCDDCGEKILIYEYASRKSLDLYLNNKDLTWVQRLEICIGAARGLAYLHDPGQTQQRVLHRDIKSSNILLDENWNARIADLGLSKFGPANQLCTFLVSNAVGTFGYIDPLYLERGLLTKESDVYSFGVVLFEMLCGRLCSGSEPLIGLVRKCYKQKTIDDIIFGNIKDEINPHSLKAFTTIAYQCLNREQEQRPSMTMVVKELESALKLQVSNVPRPPSLSPAKSSASPNESSLILRR